MALQSLKISIVICTYNRCRYLPQALASIIRQTIDRSRFELIVVDNASTDDTAMIVKNFVSEHPGLNARYIFESNKGLSFARNRGRNESSSEIIAYVDDDVILFEDYLENLAGFFEQYPDAVGAGGRVIPKYEKLKPEWMSKYLKGFVGEVDHGEEIKKFSGKMKYPAGANMIYKKSILEKAGGFNNELKFRSDDKYIFYKVKEISDEVYYLPDVVLYHFIDEARLAGENFKKLFMKTGNEEKKRLRSEGKGITGKGLSYLIKAFAGAGLYLVYIVRGHVNKGKKIWLSQWFTLKGFFMRDVDVR